MKLSELEGKRVFVWGAGREAEAFLSALEKLGVTAEVTVAQDESTPGQQCRGYVVDKLKDEHFLNTDVIVRSPGISRYRDELKLAAERGVVLTTATNLWFAEHEDAHVIGITGTKGKSTTSSLINHLLQAVGAESVLAGNIGRNPLDMIGEPAPQWWVLELSSYQVSDLEFSPQIGVLTSLSPEHLDWHGDFDTYVADKLNLFTHNPSMVTVINDVDPGASEAAQNLPNAIRVGGSEGAHFKDGSFYFGATELFSRDVLNLQGGHNEQLLCLALTAVSQAGFDVVANAKKIAQALPSFEPLPHRLSPVGEYREVLYIDDSLSTTPVASIAAMDAYKTRQVTLLVGGYDRGLDYDNLAEYIAQNRDRVRAVTLPDSGVRIAKTIREALDNDGDGVVFESDGLLHAVCIAAETTPKGGVVLLSPGAPSFGHFTNYAERGEAFLSAIMQTLTS